LGRHRAALGGSQVTGVDGITVAPGKKASHLSPASTVVAKKEREERKAPTLSSASTGVVNALGASVRSLVY
jgi:hypothetical protein